MHSYVGETYRRLNRGAPEHERRPRQDAEVDVRLRQGRAAHADSDRVPAGVADFGPYGQGVIIVGRGMVVAISWR
jgi:hypothetical protein